MTGQKRIRKPLIKSRPCAECTRDEFECYCEKDTAVDELATLAHECADGIARLRHIKAKDRQELAEYTADGLDNALYVLGARLDITAFIESCGVPAHLEAEVRP